MVFESNLHTVLVANGYKTTPVRTKVFSVLEACEKPISNAELTRLAADIDKVSVYRTIKLFESLGILHRTWNGFKSNIELADRYSPHHHHFTCKKCDSVTSFKSEVIEQVVKELGAKMGVSVNQHLVELNGLCAQCKQL